MGRKRKNSADHERAVNPSHASLPPLFPSVNTQPMLIARGERTNNVVEEGPKRIRDAAIEAWPVVQQVFVFKVLCIIHRLRPRWDFRYAEGPNLGVRLTLYGYTVFVDPTNSTTDEVSLRACRRALFQMQEVNPEWLVPPMPEGPAGLEWDWVMLLEDYCVLNGQPQPVYSPIAVGEQAWHCDVQVNDRLFHTAVPSPYMAQARNTVAHAALCRLVVTSGVVAVNRDAVVVSPAPQFQSPSALQQLGTPVIKAERKEIDLEMRSGLAGSSGPSIHRDRMQAVRQHKATAGRERGASTRRGPAGSAMKTGANNVPLSNGRLGRLQGEVAEEETAKGHRGDQGPAGDEPEEGKTPEGRSGVKLDSKAQKHELAMAVLKKMQTRLRSMSPDVPYTYMLSCFCNILRMTEPEIRVEKHPTDPRPGALVIRAYFDESNTHFHSISPMTLCYTSTGNEEKDRDRAVQQVILTLVENARTNAGIEFHSYAYRRHAKWIRDLETMLLESLYGKNIVPENVS